MTDPIIVFRRLLKNSGFAAVAGGLLIVTPLRVNACTIFVLTDAERTLFFNNEDFSNPATRLWFVPAGNGHLGCAYAGFDDGWAQGGVNTAGLAFDWVAGAMATWEPDSRMKAVRGNPAQRMLESCKTVEEAIRYFQQHREPGFSRSSVLIADRTGASVIIGVKGNQLSFERSNHSRGFGYGGQTREKMLGRAPAPLVTEGLPILRACAQRGEYATKYSNVFNLRSGDLQMFSSSGDDDGVKLNLAVELAKGGHYYDIPKLREQTGQASRPLRNEMKRFYLDEFPAIEDREPEVTKRIRAIIQDSANGTMQSEDYVAEFWSALSPQQKNVQAELKRLGDFVSLTLVGRNGEAGRSDYRYRVEFDRIIVLQRFVFNEQNQVELIQSEASELK